MSKQVLVDFISNDAGIKIAIIVKHTTLKDSFGNLYSKETQDFFTSALTRMNSGEFPDGFHFVSRCAQFVVLTMVGKSDIGISVKMMDFGNSIDTSLDHYIELMKNDWSHEIRAKIVSVSEEIRQNPHTPIDIVRVQPF